MVSCARRGMPTHSQFVTEHCLGSRFDWEERRPGGCGQACHMRRRIHAADLADVGRHAQQLGHPRVLLEAQNKFSVRDRSVIIRVQRHKHTLDLLVGQPSKTYIVYTCVFVCVCVSVCVYSYMYTHTHTHTHTQTQTQTQTHTQTHTHTHTQSETYLYMYTYIYIYIYLSVHIGDSLSRPLAGDLYIYVYIFIYVYRDRWQAAVLDLPFLRRYWPLKQHPSHSPEFV